MQLRKSVSSTYRFSSGIQRRALNISRRTRVGPSNDDDDALVFRQSQGPVVEHRAKQEALSEQHKSRRSSLIERASVANAGYVDDDSHRTRNHGKSWKSPLPGTVCIAPSKRNTS
jgi:hypothetical protein